MSSRNTYPPNADGLKFQLSDLYESWRCGTRGHVRCYSSAHTSHWRWSSKKRTGTTCPCWRHSVVMLVDRIEPIVAIDNQTS